MSVTLKVEGRNLIVAIEGDVDHHCAEGIRDKTDKAIGRYNIVNLVFDFSKVTFMDSSGIGMIIGRYKLIKANNGITIICAMSNGAKRIFDMSGLQKIIESYDTLDEALSRL